jgi:hypothetical protein
MYGFSASSKVFKCEKDLASTDCFETHLQGSSTRCVCCVKVSAFSYQVEIYCENRQIIIVSSLHLIQPHSSRALLPTSIGVFMGFKLLNALSHFPLLHRLNSISLISILDFIPWYLSEMSTLYIQKLRKRI